LTCIENAENDVCIENAGNDVEIAQAFWL